MTQLDAIACMVPNSSEERVTDSSELNRPHRGQEAESATGSGNDREVVDDHDLATTRSRIGPEGGPEALPTPAPDGDQRPDG